MLNSTSGSGSPDARQV